jgi:histidyl-tRNA synthetase
LSTKTFAAQSLFLLVFPIQIPIIQNAELFKDKVGEENNNMMYNFQDRGDRNLCLAPEYTSVIQELAKTVWKDKKDFKVFYIAQCFRGEKPQAGRYREFTQLGVEIVNPSKDWVNFLSNLAQSLILSHISDEITINNDVKRGLDYYLDGKGFEIVCPSLGSSQQICGGGEYCGGVGFAIGVDRIIRTK